MFAVHGRLLSLHVGVQLSNISNVPATITWGTAESSRGPRCGVCWTFCVICGRQRRRDTPCQLLSSFLRPQFQPLGSRDVPFITLTSCLSCQLSVLCKQHVP
ncbi:hypothetical protein BaRGS_00030840 [Batillaria attramentaria]|uniref:Secreted protein n=1 Tax=Batillaria attramentaria TaxID=370345 RepID=A0ABD0JT29_9CAEN